MSIPTLTLAHFTIGGSARGYSGVIEVDGHAPLHFKTDGDAEFEWSVPGQVSASHEVPIEVYGIAPDIDDDDDPAHEDEREFVIVAEGLASEVAHQVGLALHASAESVIEGVNSRRYLA